MPTCSSAPRSSSSMKGSPAICCEKRVQRAQSTQRSRSSSTWVLSGIGFWYVRFMPSKRESAPPVDIAWFCSGHSPPLSQTGQSSGWLISSSSITPRCAFSATGELSCVRTTMPSVTGIVQEATGLRWPSISTMHCRQAPTGSSSGWSQKRGTWVPICSAARITNVPLGTWTSTPSMVSVTRSVAVFTGSVTVMRAPPSRWRTRGGWSGGPRRWRPPGRTGSAAR